MKYTSEEQELIQELSKKDGQNFNRIGQLLASKVGDMTFNAKLIQDKAIDGATKDFLSYFTFKTKGLDQVMSTVSKLDIAQSLHDNQIPIDTSEKITLADYNKLSDLKSVNDKYKDKLQGIADKCNDDSFLKLHSAIKEASIKVEKISENALSTNDYKSGDLMMYSSAKTAVLKGRQNWSGHEGKLEEAFITKYNHAAPIYLDNSDAAKSIPTKSDIWREQRSDHLSLSEILESDALRLDPTKLVQKDHISLLEKVDYGYKQDSAGNDLTNDKGEKIKVTWQEVMRERYEHLSSALHIGQVPHQMKQLSQQLETLRLEYSAMNAEFSLHAKQINEKIDKLDILRLEYNEKAAESRLSLTELSKKKENLIVLAEEFDAINKELKPYREKDREFAEATLQLDNLSKKLVQPSLDAKEREDLTRQKSDMEIRYKVLETEFKSQESQYQKLENSLVKKDQEYETLKSEITGRRDIHQVLMNEIKRRDQEYDALDAEIISLKGENQKLKDNLTIKGQEFEKVKTEVGSKKELLIKNDQKRLGADHWLDPKTMLQGHQQWFATNDLRDLSQKMYTASADQRHMICSEFAARSIASTVDQLSRITSLDLQAAELIGKEERIVKGPISKQENFNNLHPERLLQVLESSGCVEKIENKFLKNLIQLENIDKSNTRAPEYTHDLPKKIYSLLESSKDIDDFKDKASRTASIYLHAAGVEKDIVKDVKSQVLDNKLEDIYKQHNKNPEGIFDKIKYACVKVLEYCHLRTKNLSTRKNLDVMIQDVNKTIKSKEPSKQEVAPKYDKHIDNKLKNICGNLKVHMKISENGREDSNNKGPSSTMRNSRTVPQPVLER